MQANKEAIYLSEQQAQEDLLRFLDALPDNIRTALAQLNRDDELLELVMDLGRRPSARFIDGELILREDGITAAEIGRMVDAVGGDFDDDNRAGIERTLHRISGIRNRKGKVIGVTCRIGRPIFGTADIIKDIIEGGHSVLLLGAPGVGKTTMLREIARILSEQRRVVIVDTSNEIGGDGDIPHPAVGRARRMQVPRPSHQHETMIEAVENHNPQVIVIDEIGRAEEATAARTINERGVQLVGTAHGRTLENLLLNPTLSDLVGGIESVTLSDEEARRRGTQKTVLERRSPPTFDILIEIQDRQRLTIHKDVAASVDAMLRSRPLQVEVRHRDDDGQIHVEMERLSAIVQSVGGRRQDLGDENGQVRNGRHSSRQRLEDRGNERPGGIRLMPQAEAVSPIRPTQPAMVSPVPKIVKSTRIYSYGVTRNKLEQAAGRVGVEVEMVDSLEDADMLITLKNYYRKNRKLIAEAEQQRKPVYVLRANTVSQMESFLADALGLESIPSDPFEAAILDARRGIEKVQAGEQQVNLTPVGTAMRRYQHQMARQANYVSHSYGREPGRHVRIFNVPRNESIPE